MAKHHVLRKPVAVSGTPKTAARLEHLLAERTAELEHARHQAHELFDNLPALSVTTRRGHDGLPIIEDCNKMFPATLGYTRTEILGRPLGDFYAPGSRTARETQPGARADDRLDGVQRQLLDKYGGVLDTLLYLTPTTSRNGAFVGTRAIYLDITDRTQEEQRRRGLQTRYEALVAQTLIGFCIVQDGKIVYANPKMADITGYSIEEQTAFLSVLDLIAEQDRPLMADCLHRFATSEGHTPSRVVHIRTKDDLMVPLEVQGGPVMSGGRPAVMLIALDISERIRLQNRIQQSQRLDDIGQLAGGVAHSFNNALTAIYGRCEGLLEQMSRADPRRAEVEAILAVASDTATLTRRVLAFGQRHSPPAVLDLNVVVGDTLRVAAPMVGQQTALVPTLEPLLGLVEGDAAQLEQALLTLLLHAHNVTPSGGLVRVQTANLDAPPGNPARPAGLYVTVAVTDGGPGLAPDEAARLFEAAGTDPARAGLATVQALIAQMGGWVDVETAPRHGSTITAALPRVAGTTPDRTKSAAPAVIRQTVLVVEDEAQVRTAVVEWLEQAGYQVIEAPGGAEALDLVANREAAIDLVLTDVVMPGMNGRQLVGELERTRGPLRVIYMSGYPNPVHPFEEAGGPPLLEKPFAPRTLLRAVRAALEGHTEASPPDAAPARTD